MEASSRVDLPLRVSATLWNKGRVLTDDRVLDAVESELSRWYGVESTRSDGGVRAVLPLVRQGKRSLNDWFSGPTFGEVREIQIDVQEFDRGFRLVVSARKSVVASVFVTISASLVLWSAHLSPFVSPVIGAALGLLWWGIGWAELNSAVQTFRDRCDAALGSRGA